MRHYWFTLYFSDPRSAQIYSYIQHRFEYLVQILKNAGYHFNEQEISRSTIAYPHGPPAFEYVVIKKAAELDPQSDLAGALHTFLPPAVMSSTDDAMRSDTVTHTPQTVLSADEADGVVAAIKSDTKITKYFQYVPELYKFNFWDLVGAYLQQVENEDILVQDYDSLISYLSSLVTLSLPVAKAIMGRVDQERDRILRQKASTPKALSQLFEEGKKYKVKTMYRGTVIGVAVENTESQVVLRAGGVREPISYEFMWAVAEQQEDGSWKDVFIKDKAMPAQNIPTPQVPSRNAAMLAKMKTGILNALPANSAQRDILLTATLEAADQAMINREIFHKDIQVEGITYELIISPEEPDHLPGYYITLWSVHYLEDEIEIEG